ncbi:MAG: c-type cytochrome biogenesis protein CcmI [Magnetococcales bacterium]|nr:c-type cytochrome biogenesis protein CcmI [Magnetococcales bacterium]
MTFIWTLTALTLATLAFVFYPLFMRRGGRPLPVGVEGDPRIELENQRDSLLRQLKELDYETSAGYLDEAAAGTTAGQVREELSQVLANLDKQEKEPDATTDANQGDDQNAALKRTVDKAGGAVALILVAALSMGLYIAMGSPKQVPSPEPQAAAPSESDINTMVANLAARLQNEPDNIEGWMQLGRSYSYMQRYDKAIEAYAHVLTVDSENMDAAVGLAESQVKGSDPEQFRLGIDLFKDIMAKDPNRPEPLWFLGSIALRGGEKNLAIDMWERLLTIIPPDSPARETLESAIEEAKKLPEPQNNP